MIEDQAKFKSPEEAAAAEEFDHQNSETEEATKQLIIDIPDVGEYESDELVDSGDFQKVLSQLQAEVAEALRNGVFSRGNTPGFHFEFDGKYYNFHRTSGIKIHDKTTGTTYDSFKEHEQTTGVHEKSHGDFGLRFSKLAETGEDRQFVQDVIQQLEQNNIWDRAATVVVTGWPLSALGVNSPKLQLSLDESVKNGSFNIQGFLSQAQKELSEDDYVIFQKGILNEINSIAAESKSKTIPKIFRDAFARTAAGQSDLPAEI